MAQRRRCGATVRLIGLVAYVGSALRNACFANAQAIARQAKAKGEPRYGVAHGWLILPYPRLTAVLQHAWNIDLETGRHFDVTELAEGENAGGEYLEDIALRLTRDAASGSVPVAVGRSFLYRDHKFYNATDVLTGPSSGSDGVEPWTDFSTDAILRQDPTLSGQDDPDR